MKRILLIIFFLSLCICVFSQTPPDTLWTKTFSAENDLYGSVILQTEDNGFLMLCDTHNNFEEGNIYLIKTDSYGNEEWRQMYGGDNEESARAMVNASDDCYVILGTTNSFGSGLGDAMLIKVDNSGNQVWMHTYGGEHVAYVTDLINTADGGFAFTGNYFDQGWIVKTDTDGNQEWEQTYNSDGVDRWFNSIIQLENQGFLAVG